MTDFLADLEAELLRAARRGSAPRRRPHPGVLAAAVVVLLVAGGLAAALRGASSPESAPTPAGSAPAALPAFVAPDECGPSRGEARSGPPEARAMLGVLRRRFVRSDDPAFVRGFPPVPATGTYRVDVRRAGRDRIAVDLRVVPTVALDAGACPGAMSPGASGAGVCLVVAASTPRRGVRCFTLAEVRAGRAVAVSADATVAGIVPDGVAEVRLEAGGARVRALVAENGYAAPIPGLRGEQGVRVTPVRGAPVVGPEARIVVLDGSGIRGLGSSIRRRLRSVNYTDVRAGGPVGSPLPESAIAYGPGAGGTARRIGTYLGIESVTAGRLERGTDIAVTVGSDLRRMR